MDTLIVNLYGGPGTGKSTTAALTFGRLKENGVNAEIVTEYAKELVWENREVIQFQPYIFAKQLWRQQRLRGKVDVVVTDSPLLLSLYYARHLGHNWDRFVIEQYNTFHNYDVFLERNPEIHPFNPKGRLQDEEQSKSIDYAILDILDGLQINYDTFEVGEDTADRIVSAVTHALYTP